MSSRCGVFLKFSMDMLCPSMDDLYKVKAILKSSQSIVHHTVVLQTAIVPAIVTFSKEDSLKMFQLLQRNDWETVVRQNFELLRLK